MDETSLKSLSDIKFPEKAEIEALVHALPYSAKDPYLTSIRLMAFGLLGNMDGFKESMLQEFAGLYGLELIPNSFAPWMRNNGFKAWMWGRILLAADAVNHANVGIKAEKKLRKLLNNRTNENNGLSFFVWARGYYAGLNSGTYPISKDLLLKETTKLSSTKNIPCADILWACVMVLCAAANANDKSTYRRMKNQILKITESDSISTSLAQKLTRSENNNDYPAWALAKLRRAAAVMEDEELYKETQQSTAESIAQAKLHPSKAEYVLAFLENKLAEETLKLRMKPQVKNQQHLPSK